MTELVSIQLNVTNSQEAQEQSRELSVQRKALVSQVTDAIDPQNKTTHDDIAALREQMALLTRMMLAQQDKIADLEAKLSHKADRSEVSHAISVNDDEELQQKQKLEIQAKHELLDYYDGFVFTFSSGYTAAQVILSGKISLDTGDSRAQVASHLVSLLPFGGSLVGAGIEVIASFVKNSEFQRSAVKFTQIAPNHNSFDEIIEPLARKITLNPSKQKQLLSDRAEKIADSWTSNIVAKCKQFGIDIKEQLYGERYKTTAAKLGNRDASLLIDKWVSDKIIVESAEEIADMFFQNLLVEMNPRPSAMKQEKQCTVMMITDIIYDNPILNHPSFLQSVTQSSGITAAANLIDFFQQTIIGQSELQGALEG